ncbi:hypothetical protein [Roseibium album]|uniref:hypothetical protein n=1 Tax=Roseibium album TaxID=311410 RepID=UPI0024936421|nr:hypothetical protein [Roseibium album]
MKRRARVVDQELKSCAFKTTGSAKLRLYIFVSCAPIDLTSGRGPIPLATRNLLTRMVFWPPHNLVTGSVFCTGHGKINPPDELLQEISPVDVFLYAALAALLIGPIVIWQVLPRFASSTEELRDDNFQKIYAGQDRWPGSKEANDEAREMLRKQGLDLDQPQAIMHFAERSDNSASSDSAALRSALTSGRFNELEEDADGQSVFFSEIAKISSIVFDRRTMELNDFLHEHGWTYLGWKRADDNTTN